MKIIDRSQQHSSRRQQQQRVATLHNKNSYQNPNYLTIIPIKPHSNKKPLQFISKTSEFLSNPYIIPRRQQKQQPKALEKTTYHPSRNPAFLLGGAWEYTGGATMGGVAGNNPEGNLQQHIKHGLLIESIKRQFRLQNTVNFKEIWVLETPNVPCAGYG